LHYPASVAQVNKNHSAVIAVGIHPPAKLHFLTDMPCRQAAAKYPSGKIH
jgi:hypothetical protein